MPQAHAQRGKWADPPYVPLSKVMPKVVADLPTFGKIQWTLGQLPFVAKGPHAGISGMGMVAHDGKIYLMGGFIPAGDETDDQKSRRTSRWTHRYDPETQQWTRLPNMPARREYTRAIATPHAVYVMGGGIQLKGSRPPYAPSADCFKLDLNQKSIAWKTIAPLSVPRTHMAAGYVANVMIVAGGNEYDATKNGYHLDTVRTVTEVFNLSNPQAGWQQRTPFPGTPRGWTASAACHGRFYMFGGLTFSKTSIQTGIQESLAYDPATDRWAKLTPPPLPISGWEAAAYADRYIIIVGGNLPRAKNDTAHLWGDVPFVYDTEQDRWLKIDSTLPPAAVYNDTGICIIGNTIYVAAGEGPKGSHFNHFLIGKIQPF